jgi:glycosyltransferase involved in cell wall biosynthesis
MRWTTSGHDKVRCSIVIRAYNEEKHIGRLLAGILAQTIREVEVILVDSGSTDATLAVASRYPVQILSIAPEQFTFGRSLNLGCAAAQAEFIVVASAHVYPVYPDWLEALLKPLEDPSVALTFGKQRGDSTTKFSEHQILTSWFPETSRRLDHPFCNNANAAIRRSLWVEHPYDEEIPALEDVEWASWAMSRGRAIAYVAEAEVVHVHDEDRRAIYNRYRREAMALRRIRPYERFGVVDLLRLYASNVLSDAWHALHERVFWRRAGEIAWFRWMQFWGTYRGFSQTGPLTRQLKQAFYYPRSLTWGHAAPGRPIAPIDYHSSLSESRPAAPGRDSAGPRAPRRQPAKGVVSVGRPSKEGDGG